MIAGLLGVLPLVSIRLTLLLIAMWVIILFVVKFLEDIYLLWYGLFYEH